MNDHDSGNAPDGQSFDGQSFDGLVERFQNKIYGGAKGEIRMAILQRDLNWVLEQMPNRPLQVLDAGGGLGQFSIWLAQQGHRVVYCDRSGQMLEAARAEAEHAGVQDRIYWLGVPFQELPPALQALPSPWRSSAGFDLMLCHALLEWMQQPQWVLPALTPLLRPGGWLSLLFYNRHSLVMRNLIRGNLRKVQAGRFEGEPGGLTPLTPLDPEQVSSWLRPLGLSIQRRSGVRTFYDFVDEDVIRERSMEDVLQLELELSQQVPYRDLARYIHWALRAE